MPDSCLGEAGRIYAEEHGVLEAARSEFHGYLAEVCEEIQERLAEAISGAGDATKSLFRYQGAWANGWWTGGLSLTPLADAGPFRAGKEEIYVGFGDATARKPPDDPLSVWLKVEFAGPLFERLGAMVDAEVLDRAYGVLEDRGYRFDRTSRYSYSTTTGLDTDSSCAAADRIMDVLRPLLRAVEAFAVQVARVDG